MASRRALILDKATGRIRELPAGDTLEGASGSSGPALIEAGLACDGTAQANRAVALLSSGVDLGSDPRGLFFKFSLPAVAPASTKVLWYIGGVNDGSDFAGAFACLMNSGGDLVFRLYGSNATDYRETTIAGVLDAYGALRDICVAFAADSSGREAYINDTAATLTADSTVDTNSTCPADWQGDIDCVYFVWEGSLAIVFKSFWPANFKPSEDDVANSYALGGGVPTISGNPSGTTIGDSAYLLRWAATRLYLSDFSAGTDGFYSGSDTVDGNIDSVAGEDDCLRYTDVGGGAAHWFGKNLSFTFPSTMKVRVNFDYYIPSANSVIKALGVGSGTYTDTSAGVGATLDTWTNMTAEFNGSGGGSLRFITLDASHSNAYSGATGDVVYVRNLTLGQIGCLQFLSPAASGDGVGFQLHDLGSVGADLTIPLSGWYWTEPKQRGWLRTPPGGLTWSGTHEVKSWLGQRSLPNNFIVTAIVTLSTAAASNQRITMAQDIGWNLSDAGSVSANARKARTISHVVSDYVDSDPLNNVATEPDNANWTGTFRGTIHYDMLASVP